MQTLSAFRAHTVNILKYDNILKQNHSQNTKANYSLINLPCKLIIQIVTGPYKCRPSI